MANDTNPSTNSDGNIAALQAETLVKVGVPASATAAGEVGQYSQDATHLYICLSHNTWVRATLAAW